jgi:hypothetical protein
MLFILRISEFIVNWFLLLITKSNKESTFWEGTVNIFNFLNKCLHDSLFLQLIIIRVIYLCILKTFIPWNVLLRFRESEFTINHSLIVLKTEYNLIWQSLSLCVETGAVMLRVPCSCSAHRPHLFRPYPNISLMRRANTAIPPNKPRTEHRTSFVTMFCY